MIASASIRSYTFASKTQPGTYHTVLVCGNAAECNCPGWERHRRCWHTQRALNLSKGLEREMETPTETAITVAEPRQSTTLVPIEVNPPAATLPTQQQISIMAAIASRAVAAQGLVPKDIDTPDKAFAVMLAGWEVGCKPMTSLRHIYVVNGRTEPDAQLMMGVVRARDPSARFLFHETTAGASEIELQRAGRTVIRLRCTIDDVPKALKDKPGPWSMYRADMLRWFTLRRICRLGAPDLINAISGIDISEAADEMGGAVDEAEAIDVDALPAGELVNEGDDASAAALPEGEPEPAPAPQESPTSGLDYFLAVAKEQGCKTKREAYRIVGLPEKTEHAGLQVGTVAQELGVSADWAWAVLADSLKDIVKLAKKGETWDDARGTVQPMAQLRRRAEEGRATQEKLV